MRTDSGPLTAHRARALCVVAAAVLACTLTSTSISKYGLGITPDSVSYLAAADSFRQSGVFLNYDGRPFAEWPPGYPALLSVLSLEDPGIGARHGQILLVGLLIALVGTLLVTGTPSLPLYALSLCGVVVASPLVTASSFLWSEIPYVLVVSASAIAVSAGRPVAAIALVSIACLIRYAGLSLLPALAVTLVIHGHSVRTALQSALLASAPVAAWLGRNIVLTGAAFGGTATQADQPAWRVAQLADAVGDWVVPALVPEAVASVGDWFALASLLTILGSGMLFRVRPEVTYLSWAGASYLTMLMAAPGVRGIDAIDQRLLVPVVVPAIVCVGAAIQALKRAGSSPGRSLGQVVTVLWGLAVLSNASGAFASLRVRAALGAGGLARDEWRLMPFLSAVEQYKFATTPASNKPYVVYWLKRQFAKGLDPDTAICPALTVTRRDFVLFATEPQVATPLGWEVENIAALPGGVIVSAVRQCPG